MDTITVTPRQLSAALKLCIEANQPAMVWGPPGVGKSEITQQVTKSLGRDLFDVRLLVKDSIDLSGYVIPHTMQAGKMPQMTSPTDLPDTDYANPSVLFLDELNAAPRATQAAAYQLILDGRINSYRLPENCARVAAGNRISDRGVIEAMPTPLRDRFTHFELTTSLPDWKQWAMDNGVHAAVICYHTLTNGENLHVFDPKASEPAFTSPRGWKRVSNLLNANAFIPSDLLRPLLAGNIGSGIGAKFSGFLKVMSEVAQPDQIWLNPNSAPLPHEPAACYAVVAHLAHMVRPETMPQFVAYISRFVQREFQALAMDLATKKDPSLACTRPAIDWFVKNKDILGLS